MKALEASLNTLNNIQQIKELLVKNMPQQEQVNYSQPSEEELKTISEELVLWLAEEASFRNATIQKAYAYHLQEAGKSKRGTLELLENAYKLVKENWGTITFVVGTLRELGYLRIENHPKVKALIDKIRKKEQKQ
jgi:hypothetical protein